MDVKEWLKNYRKNEVKISIAEATGKFNDEIENLTREKKVIDVAIGHLMPEQQMAIDEHYRNGRSFERCGRQIGYGSSTVYKRCMSGIKTLECVLNS